MAEQLAVTIERVDDIPVLIAAMERMGLAELADEYFEPHGTWRGLSGQSADRVAGPYPVGGGSSPEPG